MEHNDPQTEYYLRINEIKNHHYCPRIPFYTLCLHLDRETVLSRAGIDSEATTKRKMKRRKHALHSIHDGTRHFDVWLAEPELEIIGCVDEVIATDAGIYLVDYKDTDQDYGYWALQLCAYRLAAQANDEKVLGCYVYTVPTQTYHAISITRRTVKQLHSIIAALHNLIERQVCPDPTPHQRKCLTCQYRCFCNDRV